MGGLSWGHWLVVILLVVLLFGAGKVKRLGGELAEGITAFKKGMKTNAMATLRAKGQKKSVRKPSPKKGPKSK